MKSSDELAKEQQEIAIAHEGAPARLLAGPGTGKTWSLTQRVIRLVKDPKVLPINILVLTFTRAAAQELRQRVRGAAGDDEVLPRVSTLHSFALRQILLNAGNLDSLPSPLRIADDWEERNIIEPDIKKALELRRVREVRDLFAKLASDWETLRADASGWKQEFPHPGFVGAWEAHREMYGYTLRSELVYQLKRAIEQSPDFEIEGPPLHLLIDEYQDLNQCDIAVVNHIRRLGAELYVVGDDDQSIYGFRNAHPLAIRDFTSDVPEAADLRLEVCRRCSPAVLKLADSVIRNEVGRVPKDLRPQDGRAEGVVQLRSYTNQREEAQGIAEECAKIVASGVEPSDIMILLRSDRNGVFSEVIEEALRQRELPVHTDVGQDGPFDTDDGRRFLSLLRLAADRNDSLAWRALVALDHNRLGEKAISDIESVTRSIGGTFASTVLLNLNEDACGQVSGRLRTYAQGVLDDCTRIHSALDVSDTMPDEQNAEFVRRVRALDAPARIELPDEYQRALGEIARLAEDVAASELPEVIRAIGATRAEDEAVIEPSSVNILSMHKAKGLGSHTVFIAAAEDEYIPGRADTQEKRDEERRLLYVSISRAKEQLFITYCGRRTDRQLHTGRTSGQAKRTLTRFLRNSYLKPK